MLHNKIEILSPTDIELIHETSMKILSEVGFVFQDDDALSIFRKHGVETEGSKVFLKEDMVMKTVAEAPSHFTIRARNPEKSVTIGKGQPVFAPGYGAPFIHDPISGRRKATLNDYRNLVRLVDALPNQDMSGYLLVQPDDVSNRSAHLHMLRAGMTYSDKPFLGSAEGQIGARQTMEMAKILFDEERTALMEEPVTMSVIDSSSPLYFNTDMAGALMEYARWRQPILMVTLVMAGATGPITLAGTLAQQNAEILAGNVLAQLISPGTPVIYGSISSIIDMRTGMLSIGGPELAMIAGATVQMADYYSLPRRGGGTLTDSHGLDAQAGSESMMNLLISINSGADFVLHTAGILSSFLAVSFEKFVLDDEICAMIRHFQKGIPVTEETLAFDVIANTGPLGNFLKQPHTVERCRSEFWLPKLNNRADYDGWVLDDCPDSAQRAAKRWKSLLAEHEDPPLDAATAGQLEAYVNAEEKVLLGRVGD